MKMVGIDPSSTKTGYAVGTSDDHLIEAGVLTAPGKALDRIGVMADEVRGLLNEHMPDVVVIEVASGHTHRRMGKNVSFLPIYGMAVGAMYIECRRYVARQKHAGHMVQLSRPDQNEWTRGANKKHRQLCVAHDFPNYNLNSDKGADAADAIGLLQWWFRQKNMRNAPCQT